MIVRRKESLPDGKDMDFKCCHEEISEGSDGPDRDICHAL